MKKIILALIGSSLLLSAVTIKNIDSGLLNVSIKNFRANVLNFPFLISDAKIASTTADHFAITAKKDSVVIIPSADSKKEIADLIVWSRDGYTYLLKLNLKGKEQFWKFTSNRVRPLTKEASRFETGRIDKDIKKLIATVIKKGNIPGYRKVRVKRVFNTKDMIMQKDYLFDGSKYRVEIWYLKNKTRRTIKLDEGSIYTKGVLGISFSPQILRPNQVAKMYLILDKATLETEYK